MKWRELLQKRLAYGKYDYQIWVTDKKYTVERYLPSVDDHIGEHEGTAFAGSLYCAETDVEKLQQIIEDIRGLADEIEGKDDEEQSDGK